jgi:PAS domain S-box-containing protein
MITDLSSRFVHLPPEQVDAEIESAMKQICETLGLDRSELAKLGEKDARFHMTHCWAAAGISRLPDITPHEHIPWITGQILSGSFVQFSTLDDFPEEAIRDRETTREIVKAKSGTIIPLSVGGRVFGAIAFDAMVCERTWSAQITERLCLVAQVFANALARKDFTERLQVSEEKLRLATDSARLGVWEWRFDQQEIWGSEHNNVLAGLAPDQPLTFDHFIGHVHPADRDHVSEVVRIVQQEPIEFNMEYRFVHPDGQIRWLATRGRSFCNGNGKPDRVTGVTIDTTERKQAERELAERARLGKILPQLSATFINLKAVDLKTEIEAAQRRLCTDLGFDRCTLFEFVPGTTELRVTHSWVTAGLESANGHTVEDFPWTTREILAGRSFHFSSIEDLPQDAISDKETSLGRGLKSCAVFPVSAAGETLGALAFVTVHKEREWPGFLLEALHLVSQVFANAIARKRFDDKLQKAYSEIKTLKDQLEEENLYLREEIKLEHQHHEVIGQSEGIRRVLKSVEQVAPTDSTVMLLGETGTGKELIARAIHDQSRRKDRPMVKVNCAALPATLVESELFGREKGAYTGALTREPGRFEVANGSTLFLDEIGELPLELQAKLLRVLQEGEFERLGSSRTIKVDVRIVVATARDLMAMVREGKFREDLFYRVSVFPIHIPPLRERREDIPMLVWHFVREIGRRMGRNIEDIRASTMKGIQNYAWPGNVRELRNVIERHLITTTGPTFEADLAGLDHARSTARKTLDAMEEDHIAKVLKSTGGRIRGAGGAAEILGLKPSTLESRMKKLGVSRVQ